MAFITLKSRKDPFEVPNDVAKRIKAQWGGIDVPKASSEDIVELEWITFQFGQIKTIEMTREKKVLVEDWNRPLTPEEMQSRDAIMKKARANLEAKGLIKPKKKDSLI